MVMLLTPVHDGPATDHPFVADPPGDVRVLLSVCANGTCARDVPVDEPALDIVWGDVSASATEVTIRVGVVDIDSAASSHPAVSAGVNELGYQATLDYGGGVFTVEVVRAVGGAVSGRGHYTDSTGVQNVDLGIAVASIDGSTDTATLVVSYDALNAALSAAGKAASIGLGSTVEPRFFTRRWRNAGSGVAVSDRADDAIPPTTYRLGD